MYTPGAFAEADVAVAVEMVRRAGFGHVVVVGDALASTPMPVLVDDEATVVRGHLARHNPVLAAAPCDALVIVPVSDAYVSPNWYPSKAEHGRAVPTWNYEVVHLHGRLAARDDDGFVLAQIRELTDHHEGGMGTPWSVDDAPTGYIDQMRRGIVGVELHVTTVTAKRKLSQNRSDEDRQGTIDGLAARDARSAAVAESMRGR